MLVGVGSLVLTGATVAVVIGWLSSRRWVLARVLGFLVGTAIAAFCLFVVSALVADGGGARLGGVLAVGAFAMSGVAAIVAMVRGLRGRSGPST